MGYDLLFNQAIKLHESGNLIDAEKIYRKILETNPNHPDILNLLGLIAQEKGIHVEAVDYFYQAIKSVSNHAPFHFNLAVSLAAWGKPYEAIDAYLMALKLNPNIAEAYLNMANIYLDLKDKQKAKENFYKCFQLNPNFIEAKANIAFIDGDIDTLEQLKKQFPAEASIYYFLSKIYQSKKLDNALENINQAIQIAPNSDLILFQMAFLHLLKDHISQAKSYFEKALIQAQKSHNLDLLVNIFINLGNIETKQNNKFKAEEYYKKALELNHNNLDAHLNYASLLYLDKRLPQALEEYRAAVVINPNIPEISNNIGLILRDLEIYDEALGLFFNAFYKNPQKNEFAINIVETLYLYSLSGKKEEAKKIAENWIKSNPDNIFAQQAYAAHHGEISKVDASYNEILFDNFAKNYEKTLMDIKYSIIEKVAHCFPKISGKVLDLGCGTGLLGEKIHTFCSQLVGIDISQEMLTLAKEKNVYNLLVKEDASSYLKKNHNFDWCFALDVFVYLSDLNEIISNCKTQHFCFSIELLENCDENFILTESGRYKHNPVFIENMMNKYDFNLIEKQIITLRIENNIPVKGVLYLYQKK